MNAPFLIINPKNFLNLKESDQLAKYADELALKYDVNLLFSAPFPYLSILKNKYANLKIIAQHVDDIEHVTGMGKVSVEALTDINIDGVVLNHAENPLTYDSLTRILKKIKKTKLFSIVCCNSIMESRAVALLDPNVILCEPTELIGKGEISDISYIKETNRVIKDINPNILVEQAAGVSNGNDVYNIIMAGSDGTGATSSIVKSDNPKKVLLDMVKGLRKAKLEREKYDNQNV